MYGVFMAEVAVDTQTGKTKVDKFTVMADVGKINNKLVVDGQIYGGVAQGIGLALSEDFEDLKKHTTLRGLRHPVRQGHPGCIRNPLRRELRGNTARSARPASANCRLTSSHVAVINAINNATRGAHHPSAGPAGEGAGRVEGHVEKEQMIAGCTAIAGR